MLDLAMFRFFLSLVYQRSVDEAEAEMTVCNLIRQGYLKGVVAFGQGYASLSRVQAFPPLQSAYGILVKQQASAPS